MALLAGFALRHDVPYPIVLVLGGLGLGFVPWLPAPELEPDVVFFAFLPPLLYAAAFPALANAGPIALPTFVAVVAHHLIASSSSTSWTGWPTRRWSRWPARRW